MRLNRNNVERVIGVLNQRKKTPPAKDLRRRYGVSEQTPKRWMVRYKDMQIAEEKLSMAMEDESRRLKHVLAEVTLSAA